MWQARGAATLRATSLELRGKVCAACRDGEPIAVIAIDGPKLVLELVQNARASSGKVEKIPTCLI